VGILDFFSRIPSRARFAKIAMQAARERGVDKPLRFDEPNFRIVMGENDIFNLDNFYYDYCRAPRAGREAVVAKYAHLFAQPAVPASFADVRRHLLPVLRAKAFLQALRQEPLFGDGSTDTRMAAADFSDDTTLMLAYDTEHLTRTLDADQFTKWGVSVAEATAIALDNLRDLAAERFVPLAPGLFASDWNDAYDSSRLLLADLVHRVAGPRPVAMIPTRGRMLLSATRSTGNLLALLGYAKSALEQEGRRVSTLMYEFVDGRPVPFVPDDEEVARGLADLRRVALQEDYAEQKQLLEQLHQKQGIDVFVASYMLYKGEDERMFSVASWTEGVDTLLPQADRVSFVVMDEAGQPRHAGIVAWEQVEAVAGHLMRVEEGSYPVRYRVTGFPALGSFGLQ
jgi:hypothetical protein